MSHHPLQGLLKAPSPWGSEAGHRGTPVAGTGERFPGAGSLRGHKSVRKTLHGELPQASCRDLSSLVQGEGDRHCWQRPYLRWRHLAVTATTRPWEGPGQA